MPLLKDRDRQYLKGEFQKLVNPVKLAFFTQGLDCDTCAPTKEILDELAGLDERIQVQTFNRVLDTEPVAQFDVKRIPAIAVLRVETEEQDGETKTTDRDYGIRFYGIPSGYEFASLIGDIMDVSRGDSGLSPASREALAGLTQPLHLQVFTTPTWPHCPTAVRLAHKMAMESSLVRADMIEATEFPELSDRYAVYAVPLTMVNDEARIEGGMPEAMFLQRVLAAAQGNGNQEAET